MPHIIGICLYAITRLTCLLEYLSNIKSSVWLAPYDAFKAILLSFLICSCVGFSYLQKAKQEILDILLWAFRKKTGCKMKVANIEAEDLKSGKIRQTLSHNTIVSL